MNISVSTDIRSVLTVLRHLRVCVEGGTGVGRQLSPRGGSSTRTSSSVEDTCTKFRNTFADIQIRKKHERAEATRPSALEKSKRHESNKCFMYQINIFLPPPSTLRNQHLDFGIVSMKAATENLKLSECNTNLRPSTRTRGEEKY